MNSATDAAGIPSKSTAIISGVEASACFATSYTAVSDWAGVLRARWASANFFASAADENLHEERAQTAGGLSGGFLKALLRIGIGLDAVALDRVYGYENASRIRRFRGLSEALAREHKGERHDKWEYVSHNMMEIFFRHVNARTPFYKEKNV